MLLAAPDVIRPAFLWTPPCAVRTLGDEAAELAIQLEQDVREEERIALRVLMPVKANGMPAGLEAAIICGRQQVKSWALEMATIHDGWVTKVARVMWTAHQTKTSDDNFEHLCMLIEAYDWLRKRVNKPYTGNGNHKIVFVDQLTSYPTLGNSGKQRPRRTIEFGARENGPTGRGRVKVNRLILDEWLFGTSLMHGAFVPTMGAAGDRYIRYGSSPGRLMSAHLRRIRDRGRAGGDPSLSYGEWTAERVRWDVDERTGRKKLVRVLPTCAEPDCSHVAGLVRGCYLDDPEVIRSTNPAYGTERLTEEFVAQERLTLDVVEYARERAGIWEDPPVADDEPKLFPKWSDRTAVRPAGAPVGARVAFGVDTSQDRSTTWIAAATAVGDVVRVELVASGNGTDWVLGWLTSAGPSGESRVARVAAVAMQGSGAPVSGLADELEPALGEDVRDRLRRLTIAEMSKAAAKVWDLVDQGGVEIVDHAKLSAAAAGATSRPMGGDSWVIDRRNSATDAAPAVAACVAVWALLTEPEAEDYDVMDSIG